MLEESHQYQQCHGEKVRQVYCILYLSHDQIEVCSAQSSKGSLFSRVKTDSFSKHDFRRDGSCWLNSRGAGAGSGAVVLGEDFTAGYIGIDGTYRGYEGSFVSLARIACSFKPIPWRLILAVSSISSALTHGPCAIRNALHLSVR
jgi:hypothetical protein